MTKINHFLDHIHSHSFQLRTEYNINIFRFDYSDGDYYFDMGGGLMMDTEGNLMQDMGGGMAIDLDSGELHIMEFDADSDEYG